MSFTYRERKTITITEHGHKCDGCSVESKYSDSPIIADKWIKWKGWVSVRCGNKLKHFCPECKVKEKEND